MQGIRGLSRWKKAGLGAVLAAALAGGGPVVFAGGSAGTQGVEVLGASTSIPAVPTITSGPADGSTTSATTAAFTYTSQKGAGFQCSLDGAPFTPCAKSGIVYTGLDAGSRTFRVAAQQGNGPLSAPASRTWTVAPPAAPTITAGPDDVTTEPAATFEFTGTGTSYQCRLDGAPFSACSSPHSYDDLEVGDHTFGVRAIDSSGNPSAAASDSWTVATGSFGISGGLAATTLLAPGVSQPLNLTFDNPYRFSGGLKILTVSVTVQQATVKTGQPNPACVGPDNIDVAQATFTAPLTVPRSSSRSLFELGVPAAEWPQIKMRNLETNQDACKGTTFNFTYTGTATK